ncbi:MAG: GNAT family N-acetyltransferase [Erysipelotrichaceae bacterium]|nr:GNAT family N-acetyltransferase [Erysipelotrichaceae bacterium]
MKYVNYAQKYDSQLIDLWNECLPQDRIDIQTFMQRAVLDDNFDPEMCWLALDDKDQPAGFIMATKRKLPYMERGLEPEKGWINVMFVRPDCRRQGIGRRLYQLAEDRLREMGARQIILAAYSPGYFFAGVDEKNYPEAGSFFREMGFESGGRHYSMERDLTDLNADEVKAEGCRLTHFTYDRSVELLEFLKNEFGGGWKRSALLAMRNNTAEDVILLVIDENGRICGFSMSGTYDNPERFGPIGVSASLRNKGVGTKLLNYSLKEIHARGINRVFFMMTEDQARRFYERNNWKLLRTFTDYKKQL